MIPIVNRKYQYILLYSAKSACTSLRSLYLALHKSEMTPEQLNELDWYHNLNEIHPFESGVDYSDYYVYTITRNPYSRVVSAFLDQYVYAQNESVRCMMQRCPPADKAPDNFIEFLEYLRDVPDQHRDIHFQTQSYFPYVDEMVNHASSWSYRLFGGKPESVFGIDLHGDISTFDKTTIKAFKRIFKKDKVRYRNALKELKNITRKNSSFYGQTDYPDAGRMPIQVLNDLVFAPKPQDFFVDKYAVDLVKQIYLKDFTLFSYSFNEVPKKQASQEIDLIPNDFDWQMYLRLNPDLPHSGINSERSVVRHYLEFGRFEVTPRAYKIEAPKGFVWTRYLDLNPDLLSEGISTEEAAVEHYISYGIRQERPIC